ncbi:MAG: MFS transporter, partial [Trueperaceae bacterium]|nr:MFS transporter [Trueperaceae bacterium]
AIVGAELAGRAALAGAPAAAFQFGGAGTALLVGWMLGRLGRRRGMTVAALLGTLGMAAAALAVAAGAFAWLLPALVLAGTGNAAVRLARFTAAEIVPFARRGRAVAIVVTGGTVGSVVGPAVVAPSGAWSAAVGLGTLTGPFVAATIFLILAAASFHLLLRPEPSRLAVRREAPAVGTADGGADAPPDRDALPARPLARLLRDPGVATAIATLVLAQGVMVMLMAITSLHMDRHDHALSLISLVISGHTLGMFAFSILSGIFVDRFGRLPVLLAGGAVLLLSTVLAPLSPGFVPIFVALFLLGYGWNLAYVAGSALLADHLSAREATSTQGLNDFAMGTVSATASLLGGVVFAAYGFGVMSAAGAVGSVLLLAGALAYGARLRRARRAAPAS